MSTEMFYELEWKGVTYKVDDPISFKTLKGRFRFKSWERNNDTGTSWVNVWEENRCWRAFRLEEIKKPKQKKKRYTKKGRLILEGICADHKQYTGQRKPRTNCSVCWDYYWMNNE